MEDSKDVNMQEASVEASPSRSKDLTKTLSEDAVNHFLQGKRHMLIQDFSHAVQSLAKACELYTDHFGELALECGEVYFLYGKALFRLSQMQSGVLGDALQEGVADDEEKSSEEEGKENDSEKESDGEEENPEEADGGEESNDPSESTDSPQAAVVEDAGKDAPGNKDGEKDTTENEDGGKETPENEEKSKVEETTLNETEEDQPEPEEDDLELAWNSLETAKTIFSRQGEDNVEAQLKVADILQLLSEISMESDNNPAAIKDLEACLVIKERHLKDDDRVLAETYYQMGLAQMLEKMYKEAMGNFMTTAEILKKRKSNLQNTPIPDDPGSFARIEAMKEVEDLDSVLEDIQEKIEDTKELIQNAHKEIEEALLKKEKESEQIGFSTPEKPESSSKPVTNITHLLKRKKPDQDDSKNNDSKRIKLTSIQNGDATVDK